MTLSTTTRVLVGALAATLAVGLTACGAGSEAGTSDADKQCSVDQPGNRTTVNILAYTSPSIDPFSKAMAGCTSGKLVVNHANVDFNGQLTKANLSLAAPHASYDLVEVYTSTLNQYAAKGWLQPLDDDIAKYRSKYGLDDLDPTQLKQFTYKGHVYGLPMQVNVHELVYRKDIFDKLGLKAPQTFDELRAAAKKIQDAKVVKYPLTMPIAAQTYVGSDFNNSLTSLGGHLVDPATNRAGLDSPVAQEALASLQSLVPFMSDSAVNTDEAASVTAMQTGQAAMSMMYSGDMGQLTDPKNTKYATDLAFAAPPAVKAGGKPWGTVYIDGFGIAKNSSAPHETLFQLIAQGTSADVAKRAGTIVYPSRLSVIGDKNLSTSTGAAYWPGVTAALKGGVSGPEPVPYFGGLVSAVGPDLAPALFQGADPKTVLGKAQSDASAYIQQNGK